MSEVTLGGYMAKHARSAAFGGSDGRAYSVGIWIDDSKDERGRYGAALVFVRWDKGGEKPDGHVETDYLAWGSTPEEAEERLKALSLFDVKAALDEGIAAQPPEGW
jgi:hypothetical protein